MAQMLIKYGFFLLIEIGIYFMFLYRYRKNDPLYWITLATLTLCLFFKMGKQNDFVMRVSIPGVVYTLYMVIDALDRLYKEKKWVKFAALIIVLAIGSVTPVHELNRSIDKTISRYDEGETSMGKTVEEDKVMSGLNFSSDATDDFFYKYLADK